MTLTLNSLPEATIAATPADTACVNDPVQFSGSGSTDITGWQWVFGDGNTANGQNAIHSYTSAGIYQVLLIVTNTNNCIDTAAYFMVIADPLISFTSTPNPSCVGDTVWFTGIGDATFTEWLWDFGDGNTATGQNTWHIYTGDGNYSVNLDVCSKSASGTQQVIPPALAEAGSNEVICEHLAFEFGSASSLAQVLNADSLRWFGGLGNFNDPRLLHPRYVPAPGELGQIDFMLVAYAMLPCSNDTSYMRLTILDGPEAGFTITPPDSICVDEVIALDATSTTNISQWRWSFGDGNNAFGQNVTHAYASDGVYTITLVVTNDQNCIDTVQYTIEVFELPVASFGIAPGNAICRGGELSFNAASSTNILQWNWDFGDGNTATGQNVTHTFAAAGTYQVSLSVYNDNSCRDTVTQQVTIFELPVCDFTISPNDTSCVNELITFNGTGTADIIAWDWDFDDGSIASGQVVTHTYAGPGTYNIMLVVTNADGCQDTAIHQRVVVEPVIDFNMSLSPSCEGYLVDFTGIGSYAFTNYVWDFGDGNNAIGKNTSHTFANPGTYTVTLTFCTSQVQHDILVNPLPVAFAGQDTASCEDVPFDLSTLTIPPSASNYTSIFWYGGQGTFNDPTLIAPIYTPEDNEYDTTVYLYMVAYGILPCHNDTSVMSIYITQGAYAFAGSDEDHCQDEPFDFANCAQPPAAYNENYRMWSGGAGSFVDPTAEVPVYIPAPGETGPITFTFIASNILNCDSLDQMTLTIHPTYYQTQSDSICFGDSLLLPGGEWVYATGFYYDTLASVWNCDSIIGTDVFVYPQVDANFDIAPRDSSCIGEEVFFTKTGSANLVSWLWDFGDGNFSAALNPSHAYITAGSYTVTFSYTDDIGCSDQVSQQVFVFNHPDVNFTANPSSACLYSSIAFTGISTDDILFWDWDFGDGNTGSGQLVTHIYDTYGAMSVTLTVTATNGCISSLTRPIFVAEPPSAGFTHNVISCDNIQFTDMSSAPHGYFLVEWEWDFGDGNTSNLQHPAHVYAAGGTYDVTLVVYADSAGMICPDSITKQVLVPGRPTVYFTWSPEPVCLGQPTTFFGTSGNFIANWYWDFGDGNFAFSQNPEHTYSAPGTYPVILFATDQLGCTDSTMHMVSVAGLPQITFSVDPNPACAGEQVAFAASSPDNVTAWLWDFGDGGTSIAQNPLHVFTNPGTYQVVLYGGDTNNCFNMASQSVVVNPMPQAAFTSSGNNCSGDTVLFYNQSVSPNGNIIQWVWDFGDGNTLTVNAPDDPDVMHVYAGGGTYSVSLSVLDEDSCWATTFANLLISASPIAAFNYQDNCAGQPVAFTDLSSVNGGSPIVSWFWEFGDPASGAANTSTLQNPIHLFSAPGTYQVLLRVTNVQGCQDTITSPVQVSSLPQAGFTTEPDTVCAGQIIQFLGQSPEAVNWFWDFGDGGVSVLQNPQHMYELAGTYQVILTVEDGNGCQGSFTGQVTVYPEPVADFYHSALPCSSGPVEFTDISSPVNGYITQWHWQFGDGTDTLVPAPGPGSVSHSYDSPGEYTVSLVVTNASQCRDSVAYTLSVLQGPEAAFDHGGDLCQGGTVQFTDLSQGLGSDILAWLWSFGDPASGVNNTSTLQNPTHIYSGPGTYPVSLTVTSSNGCQGTILQQVEIQPPPSLDWFASPDTNCFGSLTYFFTDPDSTNIAQVAAYLWNFGDPASGTADTSSLQNPVHLFTGPGTYQVSLTITDINGCVNTRVYPIGIDPPPVADFYFEQACLGDSTRFFDASQAQSADITAWDWDFGDGGVSAQQNPAHAFAALGTYQVRLIATDERGCTDTITRMLIVEHAPVSYFTYYQPCEPGALIYFSDSSFTQGGAAPIVEWLWELEPGYFSAEINPEYTFPQADSCYVVSLQVSDANGCRNTFTDTVCVRPSLAVQMTASRVCHRQPTFFQAQAWPLQDTILFYRWDFGQGTVITTATDTVSYLYQQPGTYYATLTVQNQHGCQQSALQTVVVDALPLVDYAFSAALCDEPTLFTDLSEPGYGAQLQTWQWNFGDESSGTNNTSSLQNPQHLYPGVDSTYLVTLRVTNSHGCTDSLSMQLSKGLCMQAAFSLQGGQPCNNTLVCFADSSLVVGGKHQIQTWQWDFGDGNTLSYESYQQQVCHQYGQWGQYTVTLVVGAQLDGIQYTDSMQHQVGVSAVPVAAMSWQQPCRGAGTRFFDVSVSQGVDITRWQWDFGDQGTAGDSSSLQNPQYTYPEPGTYTVTLIVENANNCQDTITGDIRIYDNPQAWFSASTACAGGQTVFTDLSTPAEGELLHWLWDFGDGQTAGGQHPAHVYPDTGNYLVRMRVVDDKQCADSSSVMLQVFPVPLGAFDIVDGYENIQGQILLDNRSQGAVYYEWDLGNGDSSVLFSPVVRYEQNGTYLIRLIAWNDNNCPDTVMMEYSIVFQGLYVPTGFYPDSRDQAITRFKPVGSNLEFYQVRVINRWGNVLWQSSKLDANGSPAEGWDGTVNGQPQPAGSYMWTISAKFKDGTIWQGTDAGDGNTHTYGNVLLIR